MSNLRFNRHGRLSPATLMWLLVAFLAASAVVVAVLQALTMRRDILERTALTGEQIVESARVNLNLRLLGFDALLASVPLQLEAAVSRRGQLDTERARRLLDAVVRRKAELRSLWLAAADGRPLAGSQPSGALPLAKDLPAALLSWAAGDLSQQQLWVSEPVLDPGTAEEVVLLVRPVKLAQRSVLAIASVPVVQLTQLMAPAGMVAGMRMTLETEDGRLLAVSPVGAAVPGMQLPAGPLTVQRLAAPMGVAVSRLSADEPAQLVARPLLLLGLRVTAFIPERELLAPWSRDATIIGGLGVTFVAILLSGGWFAHRQWRSQEQAWVQAQSARDVLDRSLDAMADAFLLCDAQDNIVSWNGSYELMYPWLRNVLRQGAPFSALLAPAARNVLGPDASPEELENWQLQRHARHLSGDVDFEQELPSGEVLHIIERRTPDGGIVSVYRDITRAERELRRAKALAESANEAKSRFLAAMSHEIRTPLNGVLGMNFVLSQTPLSAEQQHCVGTIETSGRLLLTIINDILDFSRIEAGQLELEDIDFEPRTMVDEVLSLLRPEAADKGLDIRLDWNPAQASALRGDPNRLRQVLYNLLGNAVKFTPQGFVELAVEFIPRDDGRVNLCLTVTDSGIGISPEALPRLFDRFTQADSSTARNYGGSGLGLAIARELLHMMGGQIHVASELGHGSEFRVMVPLARGSVVATAGARRVQPGARPLQVLVAEDNEVNQLVISSMLEHLGHAFELVSDGEQAIQRAQARNWDCILMDIQMPSVDGLCAARAIRRLPTPACRVPIVALTANAMLDERQAFLEAGMDDHLSKPLDIDKLAAVLERYGEKPQARSAPEPFGSRSVPALMSQALYS